MIVCTLAIALVITSAAATAPPDPGGIEPPPVDAAGGAPARDGAGEPPAQPAPPPATEAERASAAEEARQLLAVLDLQANTGAREQAPAISALLASHLASGVRQMRVISEADIETAIGLERQRQLVTGCAEDSACLVELSGAVGARYVVFGRVDRFGGRYLLSASLFDAQRARSLGKPTAEAARDEDLPRAARALGDALLASFSETTGMVTAGRGPAAPVAQQGEVGRFSIGLKIGSTFLARLRTLSPNGELDLGLQLDRAWTVFALVGFSFIQTDAASRLSVVPSLIGARHYHFVDQPWQPFWGFAVGLQLNLGTYGIFQNVGSFPSVSALGGIRYRFNRHFFALAEANTNVAQTVIQFTQSQLDGFNLELNLGVAYVF